MESLFLAGAIQALFLVIIILSKKNKIVADFILIFSLTVISIPLLYYFFLYDEIILNLSEKDFTNNNILFLINILFIIIQSSTFYLYTKFQLFPQKKISKSELIHLIPIILFLIFYIIGANPKNSEKIILFNEAFIYKKQILILIFYPFAILFAFVNLWMSKQKIKLYRKKIKEVYSNTLKINFSWLNILLNTFGILLILLLFNTLIFKLYAHLYFIHLILLISLSFAVFIIAYFGIKEQKIIDFSSSEIKPNKINSENDSTEKNEQLKQLINFVETEKPYLEAKLTIKELSEKCKISQNDISKLINTQLNCNFFDFVNKYRVEEVKNCMQNAKYKHYSLIAIAADCGFNSKTSFNRLFKKFTNMTPSQYFNKISN